MLWVYGLIKEIKLLFLYGDVDTGMSESHLRWVVLISLETEVSGICEQGG